MSHPNAYDRPLAEQARGPALHGHDLAAMATGPVPGAPFRPYG